VLRIQSQCSLRVRVSFESRDESHVSSSMEQVPELGLGFRSCG
jgi:hypothetical protein